MDFTTQINNLRESKGDLGLLGGAGSVDPDDARVLLSVGTTMSFSHIQESALFDLATEAHNKPTSEQRKPLYYELQEKLVEGSPIFGYTANVLMAHRDILTICQLVSQILTMLHILGPLKVTKFCRYNPADLFGRIVI